MKRKEHKLPLGVTSQRADNRSRNIELANAISRNCEKYCKTGNSKERDTEILEAIRGWAMEIVFNCDAELELNKMK